MSGHVTLLGAEEVSRAASCMQSAADTMGCAANNLNDILERHQRFMDDWLYRLQTLMEQHTTALRPPQIVNVMPPSIGAGHFQVATDQPFYNAQHERVLPDEIAGDMS